MGSFTDPLRMVVGATRYGNPKIELCGAPWDLCLRLCSAVDEDRLMIMGVDIYSNKIILKNTSILLLLGAND